MTTKHGGSDLQIAAGGHVLEDQSEVSARYKLALIRGRQFPVSYVLEIIGMSVNFYCQCHTC
jgi:hypothetical protein